jgi:hypothetical protein
MIEQSKPKHIEAGNHLIFFKKYIRSTVKAAKLKEGTSRSISEDF